MRERHSLTAAVGSPLGITPARAGKTVYTVNVDDPLWDHPRPCGKDISHFHYLPNRQGSPPPVRERPLERL